MTCEYLSIDEEVVFLCSNIYVVVLKPCMYVSTYTRAMKKDKIEGGQLQDGVVHVLREVLHLRNTKRIEHPKYSNPVHSTPSFDQIDQK